MKSAAKSRPRITGWNTTAHRQPLLEFNRRVLEQAKDPGAPLLERLRFLCISISNLDEFFEIRVARLKEEVASGSVQAGPDNMSTKEMLERICEIAHRL